MDRFLDTHNLLKLSHKDTESINKPITKMKNESVTKTVPKKEKPRTEQLHY